jgi:hypothetical protein
MNLLIHLLGVFFHGGLPLQIVRKQETEILCEVYDCCVKGMTIGMQESDAF